MPSDSAIALYRPTQPRTFVGLMTLYESNFIRLVSLLPNFQDLPDEQVSSTANDLPLYLTVRDKGAYTTTLHMTYLFQEAGDCVPDPDLTVRIYHDARMVETMRCSTLHRHRVLESFTTEPGRALHQRWQRNMMLNKWLEYCIDVGHQFDAGNASRKMLG